MRLHLRRLLDHRLYLPISECLKCKCKVPVDSSPITHVMIASRSVFGVDQPYAFDWRLANRTYLPIARMAVGSPGEHGAPRTTETLVASACALAPEEGDPPLIYGCRTQARPASLLPDGAFVCSNPAAVPN